MEKMLCLWDVGSFHEIIMQTNVKNGLSQRQFLFCRVYKFVSQVE